MGSSLSAQTFGNLDACALDEPFYTLDAERTALSIRMVRHIQDEDKSQVELFTKDNLLTDTAKLTLKNPIVHDL